MRLLLFDIDGTLLLKATSEHRAALDAAIVDVHGVAIGDALVEQAGRTDLAIARSILELCEVAPDVIDTHAAAVGDAACAHYARLAAAPLDAFVAPGIPELLAALSRRSDVRLALLTGNLEPIARHKLRLAGIGEFFASGQGAFGSDAEDRAALPDIARERAGDGGVAFPREQTVIIGDTPRDIACARAGGVGVIAVATGPYPVEELAQADAVAADAHELMSLL